MADLKISQLTGATTPLAGTEVLPIVQSGTTKKVSVDDLTAGKTVSASKIVTPFVGANTADGADSGTVAIGGGGAAGSARGGTVEVRGNEATLGGLIDITSGNVANSYVNIAGRSATSTIRFAVNTIEAMRILSSQGISIGDTTDPGAGNLRLGTGNLAIGTAAKGVNFTANTPAAGMTSQLLNWYETGTWTPTLTCSDGNFTSVTYDPLRGGSYTRIGNMVHVQVYMRTDAVDNTVGRTGDVLIGGLPFSAVAGVGGTLSGHCSLAVSVASAWTGDEPIGAFISGGTDAIQLLSRSAVNGNTANITATAVNTGANANIVLVAGTYICA